jgi:hypothetical protein
MTVGGLFALILPTLLESPRCNLLFYYAIMAMWIPATELRCTGVWKGIVAGYRTEPRIKVFMGNTCPGHRDRLNGFTAGVGGFLQEQLGVIALFFASSLSLWSCWRARYHIEEAQELLTSGLTKPKKNYMFLVRKSTGRAFCLFDTARFLKTRDKNTIEMNIISFQLFAIAIDMCTYTRWTQTFIFSGTEKFLGLRERQAADCLCLRRGQFRTADNEKQHFLNETERKC